MFVLDGAWPQPGLSFSPLKTGLPGFRCDCFIVKLLPSFSLA
jgi:hypothetical protein